MSIPCYEGKQRQARYVPPVMKTEIGSGKPRMIQIALRSAMWEIKTEEDVRCTGGPV